MSEERVYLSPRQFAERVGCTRTNVYWLIRFGKVRAHRDEVGDWRISAGEADRFRRKIDARERCERCERKHRSKDTERTCALRRKSGRTVRPRKG